MIANALWAGLYGATFITALLFFLNDGLAAAGLLSWQFVSTLAAIVLVYAPAIAVLLSTLFIFVRFFAARRLGVAWLSLKATVWFGAATLGVMTGVYYRNLGWAVSLMSPAARESLRIDCAVMAFFWLLAMTAAGLGQFRAGETGHPYRVAAGIFLLAPLAMTGILMAGIAPSTARAGTPAGLARVEAAAGVRPVSPDDHEARGLLFVGLDAATMDHILPLVSARRLPTFERLLKEGASARLDSLRPCQSRVAWTALATGMPPWATGVKDARTYRLPLEAGRLEALPRALGMRALLRAGYGGSDIRPSGGGRALTLAEILRSMDLRVEMIGWRGIEPPPAGAAALRRDDPLVTTRLDKILGGPPDHSVPGSAELVDLLRTGIAADLSVRAASMAARREGSPGGIRVLALKFPGLGLASAYFLRYHQPDEFGDVSAQEQAAFSGVLARYYEFTDELLAEQIEASGPSSFIMVVSAHGARPVAPLDRILQRLLPDPDGEDLPLMSGSWTRGPDGILLVRGPGVASGSKMEEADILDVLPTALYVLGLPLGRDLRGNLARRLFRKEFLDAHPVLFVPAYGRPM